MTTLAYANRCLAADSLVTCGGKFEGYVTKIFRVNGLLVGASGSAPVCIRFCEWVRAGLKGECPFEGKDEGNGLVVMPDGLIVVWGHLGPWLVRGRSMYALGSGQEFALGALELGATAAQAVAVAMKHDTGTGGEIVTLRH